VHTAMLRSQYLVEPAGAVNSLKALTLLVGRVPSRGGLSRCSHDLTGLD